MIHLPSAKLIDQSDVDLNSHQFFTETRIRTQRGSSEPICALDFLDFADSFEEIDIAEIPVIEQNRVSSTKQSRHQVAMWGNVLGAATAIGLSVAIGVIGVGNATCFLVGSAAMFGLTFHAKSKLPK